MGPPKARWTWPPRQLTEPRLVRATARLSPREAKLVAADRVLAPLFARLDAEGPSEALRSVDGAADAVGVSRVTLWRHMIRVLGVSYSEFVGRWRAEIADALYRQGRAGIKQTAIAQAAGFESDAQMRAHFVRWTGRLPTGRFRQHRLPLFAAVP